MDTIQDPQFGDIIDYQRLRDGMSRVLDHVYPTFNLMGSMLEATRLFNNNPSYMTACAASGLAYMMLVAAEEDELAAQLKGQIFTLGWTEEHTGTDLLSIKTRATPDPDDPTGQALPHQRPKVADQQLLPRRLSLRHRQGRPRRRAARARCRSSPCRTAAPKIGSAWTRTCCAAWC